MSDEEIEALLFCAKATLNIFKERLQFIRKNWPPRVYPRLSRLIEVVESAVPKLERAAGRIRSGGPTGEVGPPG